MASRCRRAVKCRAKCYCPTFLAPARPPVRGLPQPLAPEQRSQRIGFSFRTSFKLMRAQCRPVDRVEQIVVRGGSAGLPRHADRDRRATPFIPACATVNSCANPSFGLSDIFGWPLTASPATAQSDSRPAATATYSNRPLISFWRGSPARPLKHAGNPMMIRVTDVKRRVA